MHGHTRLVFLVLGLCLIAGCSRSTSRTSNQADPSKAAALRWQQGRLIQEAESAGLYNVRLRDGQPEMWLEKLTSDNQSVKREAARIVFEYHCGDSISCGVTVFDSSTGKRLGSYSKLGVTIQ